MSEECKLYGACINASHYRCVTGCESLCKELGLCTPNHFGEGLNCIASKDSDCKESDVCLYFGRCSAKHNYCVPGSKKDCMKSYDCSVKGRCSFINNECLPGSESDCIRSWECIFNGKCYINRGRRSYCGR